MRVAVICDYLEEGWHSMDLIGDLLVNSLRQQGSRAVEVARIRPPFRRSVTRNRRLRRNWWALNTDRLINRQWLYPRLVKKLAVQFDVLHVVDHSYGHLLSGLDRAKTVVTCHDLDAFRCILEPHIERRSWIFRAMTLQVLKGLQSADAIVCDSRWTRDEILRYLLLPPERLKVVRIPVAPEFRHLPDAVADRIADGLLGASLRDPLLLHVGSTISRKRIDVLLKVFAGVRRDLPNARLVRVGGRLDKEQRALLLSLSLQDSVLEQPELPRRVLAAVYRRARLLLLPSEREGFGLPLLEALACGTPVLASDLPVLQEIGGDAVEYCPVGDIEQWTNRALSLLAENDSIERRHRGIERASQVDCSSYAEKMLNVYTTLVAN
jgi:glycosyltransferase involved in cell wall biosynthesis